jgi:RNA polymerase sigma-70 factor (ECF subfamily)
MEAWESHRNSLLPRPRAQTMEHREGQGEAEDALLVRVGQKDSRAFEALYDRYGGAVYSLAVKMLRDRQTAEEIAQEVFLAIWRGARDFDPARGSARSWILSLAHHKSVDAVRRQRLRTTEPLSETMTAEADVAQDALRGVTGTEVQNALAALSDGQREAIVFAYYGGYTQQEIATRLRVPLGTVKTRMRDGMLRLRTALEPQVQGTDQ